MGGRGEVMRRALPYIIMITLQFGDAGKSILSKASLGSGMSQYVLVVYSHAFAALSMAPLAFILERKVQTKMTKRVFLWIFALGFLGPVMDQIFYYAGLKHTSATISSTMSSITPAMTFVVAVLTGMEKVDLKKVIYQAKVGGTLVTVAGAMLMALYKGPPVELVWGKHAHSLGSNSPAVTESSSNNWFMGSGFHILPTLASASLSLLREETLKQYSARLSLMTWIYFVGTLEATVVTFVLEHKPAVWTIGFDINFLAAAYAGIVTSSVAYYVEGRVIEKRGAVFASAFNPLRMIIVAIMGASFLNEKIYLGGVLGAILIVIGLYSVLWGNSKQE
ncbi:WAT1-related protein At5g07050-like [Musa acuminata AAA Group]|uniref:WAT1-related protein At5g07050-like n=1 Tax=Musa acuminata AAA Group TaxID=214697 RepID=UPI0031DD4063